MGHVIGQRQPVIGAQNTATGKFASELLVSVTSRVAER
jgi:hypothetical protein